MKLNTLIRIWHELNHHVFDNALDQPAISFFRSRTKHAEYRQDNRGFSEILVDRGIKMCDAYVVMYHEMVHQFESEIEGKEDLDHGDTFLAHAWVADALGWKNFQ